MKYKSKKTIIDGFKFDSKLEGEYYKKLKNDKLNGLIKDFELQPEYLLQPKFKDKKGCTIRAIFLKADFVVTLNDGSEVVVDIKGYPTPVAKLKRKLFLKKYPAKEIVWIFWSNLDVGWIEYSQLEKNRKKRIKNKGAMKKKSFRH